MQDLNAAPEPTEATPELTEAMQDTPELPEHTEAMQNTPEPMQDSNVAPQPTEAMQDTPKDNAALEPTELMQVLLKLSQPVAKRPRGRAPKGMKWEAGAWKKRRKRA